MTLFKLSVSGGTLILLIVILRYCAINKLPKKVFMLLWDIVLLRLLVPFYFPVPYRFVPEIKEMAKSNIHFGKFVMQEKVESVLPADITFSRWGNIDWKMAVWFAGMIILLLYFGSQYMKEYQRIRMVWVMYMFFNRDIELSCDERVISLLGREKKREYAMVLTNLAEKQYHMSLFSNGFGNNAIQERIVAIMKFKKVTVTGMIRSTVLVGMAVTAFAKNDFDNKTSCHSVSQNRMDARVVNF